MVNEIVQIYWIFASWILNLLLTSKSESSSAGDHGAFLCVEALCPHYGKGIKLTAKQVRGTLSRFSWFLWPTPNLTAPLENRSRISRDSKSSRNCEMHESTRNLRKNGPRSTISFQITTLVNLAHAYTARPCAFRMEVHSFKEDRGRAYVHLNS